MATLREKQCAECYNEVCKCRICRGKKMKEFSCFDCGFDENLSCLWLTVGHSLKKIKKEEEDIP